MVFNVHAGHAAVGKGSVGAIGLLNESYEDRRVKDVVISCLRKEGHTVHDCTVDSGSQSQILSAIVKKSNAHKADLDISIHFNAGANRPHKDGITTGTEVYIYNNKSKAKDEAERIAAKISSLGFANRGVKTGASLYVLKKTNAPALLVECCFVDDADDAELYDPEKIGKAIVEGILNKNMSGESKPVSGAPINRRVRVDVDTLNYRKGPGTSYAIEGQIRRNEVYTISETNGSWGKLISGAGWINVSDKYVTFL